MRNKFLGAGEPGYHPLRKLKVILSGLRFAVLHDFSVAYKLGLSVVILAVAFVLRQWLDFVMILIATGLVSVYIGGVVELCSVNLGLAIDDIYVGMD